MDTILLQKPRLPLLCVRLEVMQLPDHPLIVSITSVTCLGCLVELICEAACLATEAFLDNLFILNSLMS